MIPDEPEPDEIFDDGDDWIDDDDDDVEDDPDLWDVEYDDSIPNHIKPDEEDYDIHDPE